MSAKKVNLSYSSNVLEHSKKYQTALKKVLPCKSSVNIPLYKGFYGKNYQSISLENFVNYIKNGNPPTNNIKPLIIQLRAVYNDTTLTEKQRENKSSILKKQLPCISTSCFVGQNQTKHKKNIISFTGLIQIDFDHLTNVPEKLKTFKSDIYTNVCFISPRGQGIKLIVKIDKTKDFLKLFLGLEQYYLKEYGLQLDKGCKNENRLMFLSYDPEVLHNPQSATFTDEYIAPEPEPKKHTTKKVYAKISTDKEQNIYKNHINRVLDSVEKKLTSASIGTRHTELNRQSTLLGGYVGGGFISEYEAISFLNSIVESIFNNDKSLKTELKTAKDGLNYGQSTPITKEDVLDDFNKYIANKTTYDFKPTHDNKHTQKSIFKLQYDEVLNVKEWTSEKSNILTKRIKENKRLFLVAPTGTGKTRAIFEKIIPELQKEGKKCLVAVPLRSLAKQISKEYNIEDLKGGYNNAELNTAVGEGKAVATYDTAVKIAHNFDYIFIDEAHNFLSAYSFKSNAIKNLWQNTESKNLIFITATPPLNLFKSLGFRMIKINSALHQPESISIRKSLTSPLKTAIAHIKQSDLKGGSLFLKIKSKSILQSVKKYLVQNNFATDKEILIINSDIEQRTNDKKEFDYLIENQKFNKNIKYILSTNYINDGVNIKDLNIKEVVNIENQYNPDPNELRQFIARFRLHKQLKYYIYLKEQATYRKVINTDKELIKTKTEVLKVINSLTVLNNSEFLNSNELDPLKATNFVYFDEVLQEFKTNEIAVLYSVYTKFANNLNTHNFINYLSEMYGLKIDLETYNFVDEAEINTADLDKLKADQTETQNKIYKLFSSHGQNEVFTFIAKHTKNNHLKELLKENRITASSFTIIDLNPEQLNLIRENFSNFETLTIRFFDFKKLDIADENIKSFIFSKDKESNIKTRGNASFNDLKQKIYILYLLIFKDELNSKINTISQYNLNVFKQIIEALKSYQGIELDFFELKNILVPILPGSMFSQFYAKNKFINFIKLFFEVEIIRQKTNGKEKRIYILKEQNNCDETLKKLFKKEHSKFYEPL